MESRVRYSGPRPRLSLDRLGIMASRLLLPVDLTKCPPEIFPAANGITKPFGGELVLLHVLDRRRRATRRGAGEAELARALRHLERLGRDYVRPGIEVTLRVRIGVPHEEILAEARAIGADLILLPVFAPSFWSRWVGSMRGDTIRNLAAGAGCRLFVTDVRTRFNCFRRWAKEGPWLLPAT